MSTIKLIKLRELDENRNISEMTAGDIYLILEKRKKFIENISKYEHPKDKYSEDRRKEVFEWLNNANDNIKMECIICYVKKFSNRKFHKPYIFEYIDLSEEVIKTIVSMFPKYIYLLKKPSLEFQLKAMSHHVWLIFDIENPHPDVIKIVLEGDIPQEVKDYLIENKTLHNFVSKSQIEFLKYLNSQKS